MAIIPSEMEFGARPPVDGYGPGFFRVGGAVHRGGLALLPGGPLAWQGMPDAAPFLAAAEEIDVLLVGTGAEPARLDSAFAAALAAAGLRAEVMATGPACRTYNVLLAEARRVAAALMPV